MSTTKTHAEQRAGVEEAMLDLDAFERTALVSEPFPHVVVPSFVRSAGLSRANADFPDVRNLGSFPTTGLVAGSAFADLLGALRSPSVQEAFSRKFDVPLAGRPTMITVRGKVGAGDGRIHADSSTKLISALIYMNESWNQEGGRLRLLRSRDDLDDYAVEIPPVAGNLVAFRVGPDSWHGHRVAFGVRRSLQLNWVTDEAVVRRELARHRWTSIWKHVLPIRFRY